MPIPSKALRNLFISALIALSLTLGTYTTAANLSIENFAQLPDADRFTLTPNGKKIAVLVRVETKGNKGIEVQATNLKNQKKNVHLYTDNSKYFISRIHWKDNNTLLVHTFYLSRLGTSARRHAGNSTTYN